MQACPLNTGFLPASGQHSPAAKTHSASNIADLVGTMHQWGGTCVTLTRHLLSQKISQGRDPTNLGRWTSVCFQGKQRATFTLISTCRPCFSLDQSGSVWSQHFRHFAAPCVPGSVAPDPLMRFDEDTLQAINAALTLGDKIILGVDNDSDVRSSCPAHALW